jgi:ApbE superfamily uncharacterized protein (UPF0280 family)
MIGTPPQRRVLADGRRHFQHGPIDCVLGADGAADAVAAAYERAWQRFEGLLSELVAELPLLRADLASKLADPQGPVARRMVAACRPFAEGGGFITAMAAVAGSVAEELIAAFDDPRIVRAYVNNGGDIALCLLPGASFAVGLVGNVDAANVDARIHVDAAMPIRGIATSGWRGRSFSLGIADSVTVFAATASQADAAATVIANAVDVDDARIVRRPANEVRDDSDLGDRLVTRDVPPLPPALLDEALTRGARQAEHEIAAGRIAAAALHAQGRLRLAGPLLTGSWSRMPPTPSPPLGESPRGGRVGVRGPRTPNLPSARPQEQDR